MMFSILLVYCESELFIYLLILHFNFSLHTGRYLSVLANVSVQS